MAISNIPTPRPLHTTGGPKGDVGSGLAAAAEPFKVITTEGVNMSSASVATNKRDGTATISATLEVRSTEQIVRILNKLDRLQYVLSARRSSR